MHDGTFDLDGVGFEAIQTRRAPSSPDHFGVRKSVWMIERYQELAGEFGDAAVVELGIDQGGSVREEHDDSHLAAAPHACRSGTRVAAPLDIEPAERHPAPGKECLDLMNAG